MGHLHRQALLQRAKVRDALIAKGVEPEAAKATVAECALASVRDPLQEPKQAPASARKPARTKDKKRGKKKKA